MENNKTSIPIERWGVHETHCCKKHGCKYGNIDCPVVLKLIPQKYTCEEDDQDPCLEERDYYSELRAMGYSSDQCLELSEYIVKLLNK
jgi:hypothetical protein